ncbi:tetratricopeptide repeat protein [Desulfovibrio sp. Fe33]|uniref:tetratricopeptide repeat protein n=1 Tax=Desulfovibrio sp. Fe33 TaxID=3020842 RepID=UPI00234CAB9F|nr:tetratricopeptide repeat protein [Desulfovibrio sp. Fe33]
MQALQHFIGEQRFGEAVRAFKTERDYAGLAAYLTDALASDDMPSATQAKAHNELGLALLQLEQPAEAERAFRSAIERDPKSVNPRFNLANLALYARNYVRGLDLFREILEIDPAHAGALHHAGLCCAMQDKFEEALPYFERSAEAAPGVMGPDFWAGECLVRLGRFEQGVPHFRRALEIMPDHTESIRGLAICLYETKEYAEALTACDTLIAGGGGAEYLALRVKGDVLLALGQGEKAALCHLGMAELDFDAREYLHLRSRNLAELGSDQAEIYAKTIADHLRGMDAEFLELLPEQQ